MDIYRFLPNYKLPISPFQSYLYTLYIVQHTFLLCLPASAYSSSQNDDDLPILYGAHSTI